MFEDFLEFFFTKVIPSILVIIIVLFPFMFYLACVHENEMITKCTPNPELYECQIYLAKQGKASINSAAFNGAFIGGILANTNSKN